MRTVKRHPGSFCVLPFHAFLATSVYDHLGAVGTVAAVGAVTLVCMAFESLLDSAAVVQREKPPGPPPEPGGIAKRTRSRVTAPPFVKT